MQLIDTMRISPEGSRSCAVALFGDQLRKAPGGPGHLAALARLQLDVVNLRAERNVFDRERVAGENVRFGPETIVCPTCNPAGAMM